MTDYEQRSEILQLALGPALITIKGYGTPEVVQTYGRAHALCHTLGDTPQLLPALWGLWTFHIVRAHYGVTLGLAEQSVRLANEQGDSRHLGPAHQILALSLFFLGDFARARDHPEQGVFLYDPERDASSALI